MSRIDELLRSSAEEWRSAVDAQARQDRDRRASAADLRRARRRRLLRRRPEQLVGVAVLAAAIVVVVWLVQHDMNPSVAPAGTGASCASPQLRVGDRARPVPLVRGQRVVVSGRYYVNGCQDNPGAEPTRPIASVRLALTPRGGRPIALATAHPAGELGTFRVSVTIPPDAPTGPATLGDGIGGRLRVVVR